MRLTSPAAHRPSARSGLRSRLASALLAAIGASGPAQAQYQPDSSMGTGGATLPGPRATRSAAALDGRRRAESGWWSETSITAQATLTNNANYGDVQRPRGRSDHRADSGVELPPRGRAAARQWIRFARHARLCRRHADEPHPAAGQRPGEPGGHRKSVLHRRFDLSPTSPSSIRSCRARSSRRPTTSTPTSQARLAPYFKGNFGTTRPGWSAATTPTRGLRRPTIRWATPTTPQQLAEVVRAPTPLGPDAAGEQRPHPDPEPACSLTRR